MKKTVTPATSPASNRDLQDQAGRETRVESDMERQFTASGFQRRRITWDEIRKMFSGFNDGKHWLAVFHPCAAYALMAIARHFEHHPEGVSITTLDYEGEVWAVCAFEKAHLTRAKYAEIMRANGAVVPDSVFSAPVSLICPPRLAQEGIAIAQAVWGDERRTLSELAIAE